MVRPGSHQPGQTNKWRKCQTLCLRLAYLQLPGAKNWLRQEDLWYTSHFCAGATGDKGETGNRGALQNALPSCTADVIPGLRICSMTCMGRHALLVILWRFLLECALWHLFCVNAVQIVALWYVTFCYVQVTLAIWATRVTHVTSHCSAVLITLWQVQVLSIGGLIRMDKCLAIDCCCWGMHYTRAADQTTNHYTECMVLKIWASSNVLHWNCCAGCTGASAVCLPGSQPTVCSGCTLCPAGQFSAGRAPPAAAACTSCPAGTYSSMGSAKCTPCAAGTASLTVGATNSGVCLACSLGQTSASGSQTCNDLPAWQLRKYTRQPHLHGVHSRHRIPEPRRAGCDSVRVMRRLPVCGSLCSKLKPLPAGDGHQCCHRLRYVPGGTVSGTTVGASVCTPCATGQFSTNSGSQTCTACPPGSYANTPGSTTCTQCLAGTFIASIQYIQHICTYLHPMYNPSLGLVERATATHV